MSHIRSLQCTLNVEKCRLRSRRRLEVAIYGVLSPTSRRCFSCKCCPSLTADATAHRSCWALPAGASVYHSQSLLNAVQCPLRSFCCVGQSVCCVQRRAVDLFPVCVSRASVKSRDVGESRRARRMTYLAFVWWCAEFDISAVTMSVFVGSRWCE